MSTTAVKEHPILFTGEMVQAILDGRKTQTRRVLKPQPRWFGAEHEERWHANALPPGGACPSTWTWWEGPAHGQSMYHEARCPYGQPGDQLWIKTGYTTLYDIDFDRTLWKCPGIHFISTHGRAKSESTGNFKRDGGHPAMFMPFWLSQEMRLPLLEITDVRVERVREISRDDAIAEGIDESTREHVFITSSLQGGCLECDRFARLWDSINLSRGFSWESNPWVWVVAFKVLEGK